MPERLSSREAVDRTIQVRLIERSVAPRVLPALESLGYRLLENGDDRDADFWLVDETRLDEVPTSDVAPSARILLISSPRQTRYDDERILAQSARPTRLASVYAMIQSAIEQQPRRSPRIPTELSARCIRADRRAIGAVLSLSEGGCLLRTDEKLRKGTKVDLQFALPEYGLVSTAARCCYTRRGRAGMQFSAPPADVRLSIAHFVTHQLASSATDAQFTSARIG